MVCGFRKMAFEACTGRPIPRPKVQPHGGCRAGLGPSRSLPPSSQAPAWSVQANRHRCFAFRVRGTAWGARCYPLGPSPAASAAQEKPTHSSSAIFSPILQSLRDHRARSRGLARPVFASGFRWRRGRPSGGRGLGARGRPFCP